MRHLNLFIFPQGDYEIGEAGYRVAANERGDIPEWDECGYPELLAIFPSVGSARAAIDRNNY